MDSKTLSVLAKRLRYDIVRIATVAGSGHPTSSLSAVELTTVLFFKYLRYDTANPQYEFNDRVIFSKGHASPLFYSLYLAAGAISEKEFLGYRSFDSILEGHPTPRFPFAEAATGSLGQGLAIGIGQALALRKHISNLQSQISNLESLPRRQAGPISIPTVYILLGDGELAEGSVWEAAALASYYKLNNVVAVVDINRLGQSDPTMHGHDVEVFRRRFEAFGWATIVVDGHNIAEVDRAYEKAQTYQAGPSVILAKTIKGKGISFLEDKDGWHGKALKKEELEAAIKELGEVDTKLIVPFQKPAQSPAITSESRIPASPSLAGRQAAGRSNLESRVYTLPTATRKAFGDALVVLAQGNSQIIVIDGDVKNSTYTEDVKKNLPEQFVECFIAEQTMAGVAVGFARRGYVPVVSTFAAFLTRAFDQFRMASVSDVSVVVNGSHAGVSIGADGPSQMGLEDIAQFRAIRGSTVVYPSDPYQTAALTAQLVGTKGISYIRTTREALPTLYTPTDGFSLGGSHVWNSSLQSMTKTDGRLAMNDATIIAAGITLHEALKAQKILEKEGTSITVIDCYSIKPIDEKALQAAAKTSKALIVVEDHYPEGGLGEAVRSAIGAIVDVPFFHLAVRKLPRSGKPEELLRYEEIDAEAIVNVVKEMKR